MVYAVITWFQGLSSEYDGVGVSLGNYTYNDDDKPVQFFPVQVCIFAYLSWICHLKLIKMFKESLSLIRIETKSR